VPENRFAITALSSFTATHATHIPITLLFTAHGPTPSRSDRVIAVSFSASTATTPKSYPAVACNKNNDLGAGVE